MKKSAILLAGAAAAILSFGGVAAGPAAAGIKCAGPNQVTSYGLIRTPYCEDTYLAKVAGYNPATVRHNPNAKYEACRLVGHYPRVAGICDGVNDYGNDHIR